VNRVCVLVEEATAEAREKYWDILTEVFNEVPPEQLREGMARFGPETRFYTVEAAQVYLSVLFVTPVTIGERVFGGIGGICTRREYRGLGYGRIVLERALEATSSTYGALLLWTRIPQYFAQFGFGEMPRVFVPDVGGSSPMLFSHDEESRSSVAALRDLPREYF